MFIAVDGLDGSGKSTVAAGIAEALASDGLSVSVREHPGDGRWGRLARRALLGRGLPAKLLSALFMFLDILSTGFAVRRGNDIVAVRYTLSAFYMDGRAGDLLHRFLTSFLPAPDATLLIDIDPSVAMERVGTRGDGEEMFENISSMEKVRARMLSSDEPVIMIDGDGTPSEVLSRALEALGHRHQNLEPIERASSRTD